MLPLWTGPRGLAVVQVSLVTAISLRVAGLAITTADLHPADVQRLGMSPHAITSYGCAGLCTLIE